MTDLLLFPASEPADQPADQSHRDAAVDIGAAILVQAPAGSGKTDLLTRRFLRLLAVVDEPEEILAITFTRAATAEMRLRILADLEAAAGLRPSRPEDRGRIELARHALAHSERRGWNLLNQPQRLSIETIDSLCLRIAHDRPLLAHLGGRLQPTEDAAALYALAARRTLERLGLSDPALSEAIAHLLDLRDNRLADCESLIAQMLSVRDQWLHAYPLSPFMTEDDWAIARSCFQAPFAQENTRVLSDAYERLAAQPLLAEQLIDLARYACSNGNQDVALLAGVQTISSAMHIEHWRSICNLLLTKEGGWRKSIDKNLGFPPGPARSEAKLRKDAIIELIGHFQQTPGLHQALCAIRALPPAAYSDAQWTTLRHILTILRQAIAELRVVFAERNAVDFTEIALAAAAVFHDAPDRAAVIGEGIRHLLVDEFQDTSRRQHELVSYLLSAWDPGEGRTVFLVGDPMQSIYMFRQAEVELFSHVRDHGIGPAANRIRCKPVRLSVNFRSHSGLTEPLNDIFRTIAAVPAEPGAAPAEFAEATSSHPAPNAESLHIYPQIIGAVDSRPSPADRLAAQQQEAREVLRIVQRHLPAIQRAQAEGSEYRVAVLVRARPHLGQLVPLLREQQIPFRAVEIERLSDRQELHDLLALTRALLHPMDRVAWLAVLRAPWCGLSLADLHRLTGSDDRTAADLSVLELVDRHQSQLSPGGQLRLARTAGILRRALDLRWRQSECPSFASWIELTWQTLSGPACLDAAAYENAQVFFSLLDSLPPDGLAPLTADFQAQLDRLFAQPDPSVSERCGVQLMTIHKAKGLGFEVVIVPGLDRKSTPDKQPLVASLERRNPWQPHEEEFLVAPIGPKGDDSNTLYKWVRDQRKLRFDEERKRLFYVACTRARRELHLLGTATRSSKGVSPAPGSLLQTAWPALQGRFEALQTALVAPPPPATEPSADNLIAFPTPVVVGEMAAVADPLAPRGPRRLVLPLDPPPPAETPGIAVVNTLASSAAPEFRRPQGSRQARLIGSAVHALLQRLGPELAATDPARLRALIAAFLRSAALSGSDLATATEAAAGLLLTCAADPVCQWILAPHPEAQSEASWSGYPHGWKQDSRLRTLRADRVFRAGPAPLSVLDPSNGSADCLWVIDYKTGMPHAAGHAAWLAEERKTYAPQLLAYARILRALHGSSAPMRLGLYYPAIAAFDYWDPDGVE
jgi:ATP-dependent exoDNAse (exonuclease V) beta subunit